MGSAFQRKSHAVGEGQRLARACSPQPRSKRLPLIRPWFLALCARGPPSPPKKGEKESGAALILAPMGLRRDDEISAQ